MAIRFGGPYSPGEGPPDYPERPASRRRLERRTTWITIAGLPFLIGAFFQGPTGMVMDLVAFGLLAGAMHMTRQGLKAEAAYDARRIAHRPAIPRKLFGSALTGVGLAIGAAQSDPASFAGAGMIGIMAALLHVLCFGPDPLRNKGVEGADIHQVDRVARFIEEGEGYLAEMTTAIRRTRDRRLVARVEHFSGVARGLFRQVESNPAGLSGARRYLGVYLMGARDATVKFADLYSRSKDASAAAAWGALIADLETNFADRTGRLLEGSRVDMDIEIEVLRERLAQEGVRPAVAPEAGNAAMASSEASGEDRPQLEKGIPEEALDPLSRTGSRERR